MWVDKDDVFAEDKVREFKASNPEAETHIRTSTVAKSHHPHPLTRSQLLHNHALHYMSSDGNDDLAQEYTAGAAADSPIPFSQEFPINTPVIIHSPVPIVDFATLRALSPVAPTFVPRPVTASSSASDVAAMFCQLRVHTQHPSHLTVSAPLNKLLKCLLFRTPLPKGEGVKQALAWNREQLLDLRRLWELRRQRQMSAGLLL
jgi:hypothetical protein